MENLKYIIESLLFVAEDPLTIEKLRGILETVEAKEIRETLQALAEEYDRRNGGFLLSEVAGGWQIRSRPEYHEWIKRMLQPAPQRLSKAALETLAIIAYKQPIIRADIEFIRGVDCGGVLRQLMERKLARVLGRKEIAGRPLIYATTKLFLEMFDLKNLNDLPTPAELAEFGANLDIPPADEPPEALSDSSVKKVEEEVPEAGKDNNANSEGKEKNTGDDIESLTVETIADQSDILADTSADMSADTSADTSADATADASPDVAPNVAPNAATDALETDVLEAGLQTNNPQQTLPTNNETPLEDMEETLPPNTHWPGEEKNESSDDSIGSPQNDEPEEPKNT